MYNVLDEQRAEFCKIEKDFILYQFSQMSWFLFYTPKIGPIFKGRVGQSDVILFSSWVNKAYNGIATLI